MDDSRTRTAAAQRALAAAEISSRTLAAMCGRFTLKTPAQLLQELFGVADLPDMVPRYNIAPTQPIATVRLDDGARLVSTMRWGLIPSWARDPAIGNRLINARAETLHGKRAYQEPFARRRCLIPADGFYEWERLPGGGRQAWHLALRDGGPFGFAGLWDRWRPEGGEWIRSCTIVTTTPNSLVEPIHDRMPVMLFAGDFERWLRPDAREHDLRSLLAPPPSRLMRAHRVSALVNRPGNDGPECVAEVEELHRSPTLF